MNINLFSSLKRHINAEDLKSFEDPAFTSFDYFEFQKEKLYYNQCLKLSFYERVRYRKAIYEFTLNELSRRQKTSIEKNVIQSLKKVCVLIQIQKDEA